MKKPGVGNGTEQERAEAERLEKERIDFERRARMTRNNLYGNKTPQESGRGWVDTGQNK
jgi:hypothetical protein